MSKTPLRIAWFSAADTEECISSYTTSQLLPYFEQQPSWRIEAFATEQASREAMARHSEQPYDLLLYHLEDHPAAHFVRELLHLEPGVGWFHDFYLRPGSGSGEQSGDFRKEIQVCKRALFSTERDLGEALRVGGAPVEKCCHIPFPVALSDTSNESQLPEHRERNIRIGICAGPQLEYRVPQLFAALREVDFPCSVHWLCAEAEQESAHKLCVEFGRDDVEIHGGRSPAKWEALLSHCDVAFHGLFSAFGNPGPYLQLSMIAGVPVVATDFASMSSLPADVVHLTQPGEQEIADIGAALCELQEDEARARQAKLGQRYVNEAHSLPAVGKDLQLLLT